MSTLSVLGRRFFAIAIAAFGLQQLVLGAFVTRALPEWPKWFPGLAIWPYVFGVVFVLCAFAIGSANPRFGRRAALSVAAIIFAGALLLHVPRALADPPMWGMLWTNAAKGLALGGGALIVAASLPGGTSELVDRRFVCIGRWLLGAFLIFCGYEHFCFAQYVQQLVPKWIPGALVWTYVSGAGLVAAGLGLWIPATARIAALATGVMIFAWVILLHLPRALADLHNANETTAVFEALAFSGVAFVLARLLTRPAPATVAA
jgi:uncharacterized membrane protein